MSIFNTSETDISTFFLTGIPGLESANIWVSIPICLMYFVAIAGNCTILFFIKMEPSLHEPMYYFLSMLAVSDLGLSFSSLPTMLRIFLFSAPRISPNACIAQEFFIHGFSAMESSVLLIMSFDRFIAICNPLRYASILTSTRVIKIALYILFVLIFPFIVKRLKFCKKSLLSHSYCLHHGVMKLFMALTSLLYLLCISVSYMLNLKIVLSVTSHKGNLKVLNTCISHIYAVLVLCVPIVTLAALRHFAKSASSVIRVTIADIFLLVPPLMNPIVYSVKSQQMRNWILAKYVRNEVDGQLQLQQNPHYLPISEQL
uniref:Olfactory receptor n=1 Tax=Moschus moschiferus TaxID=68415 RepID=A0A8C6E2C4_MOSMO